MSTETVGDRRAAVRRGVAAPVIRWSRVFDLLMVAIPTALVVGVVIRGLVVPGGLASAWAVDFDTYRAASLDWLAGRGFYEDYQLAGPYPVVLHEILYPPPMLLILVPTAFLPALTWLVPVPIIVAVVWSWRPSLRAWAVIAWLVLTPNPWWWFSYTVGVVAYGNPGLWVAAAVALATRFPWAAPWVLLKPTLAPFALLGVHRRSWWLSFAVVAAVSIAFLPMWLDYFTVLRNAQYDGNALLYSMHSVPLMLIPIVAWVGGRTDPLRRFRLGVRLWIAERDVQRRRRDLEFDRP